MGPSASVGLESTGRWQVLLLLLIAVYFAIVAMNHALPTFHGYTPPFGCQSKNDSLIANGSLGGCLPEGEECEGGYTFVSDRNDSTVVTEWQLVCSRRLLRSMVPTLYFCGVTLGAIAGGLAADRYGRRPTMLVGLYAQGALGLAIYFVGTLEAFVSVRFVQGFFLQVMQGSMYTLLMELFPPKSRTGAGIALEAYWAVGLSFLAACAFLLPDWRNLELALCLPTAITLLYVCWVPESPRWLATKGRHVEAAKACQLIAKRNGFAKPTESQPPFSHDKDCEAKNAVNGDAKLEADRIEGASLRDDLNAEDKVSADNSIVIGVKGGYVTETKTQGVLDLFKSRVLRKYNCIMVFNWFSISLSYYGIMFYLPDLSGDRHLNFLLGAALELASYIVAFFVLSRFGRRLPLSFYLILSGVLCVAVGAISAGQTSNEGALALTQTALALLGKAAVVSAFCTINIYTAELFPTVVRAAATGFCGFWGRVGSLLAPQLLLLGEVTWKPVPLTSMGTLVIVAGLATLFLPETIGRPLADTVEQAEETENIRKRNV